MPPKAGGKAKKSKKSAKPAWMADDIWAVSQDLPALLNSFAGIKSDKPAKSDTPAKSDKVAAPGKGAKGGKPEPLPNIPKVQVFHRLCKQPPHMLVAYHETGHTSCMCKMQYCSTCRLIA